MALVETHPTNSSASNGANRIKAPTWVKFPDATILMLQVLRRFARWHEAPPPPPQRSPDLTPVLQDGRSGRAGPFRARIQRWLGLNLKERLRIVSREWIRALKRRLGEGASPEGLTPVLQDGRSGRA